jgi:hypothetical protein
MKRSRIQLASRMAAAALAVVLAGCDGDGITTPRAMAGRWLAVDVLEGTQGTRTEDRLELRTNGEYTWISTLHGSDGRVPDGMKMWVRVAGEWGVDGEMLALRTTTGSRWDVTPDGAAWSIMDFGGEWNRGHRVRLEGDRLIVTEDSDPRLPYIPRTYVFDRVPDFDDAPPPPGAQ